MSKLTHLTSVGDVHMVDVGGKPVTHRAAVALSKVYMSQEALLAIKDGQNKKGDVIAVAKIAGIQAAKRCSELIPLCHSVPLSSVEIEIDADVSASCIKIISRCSTISQTGVEMEALTAASIASLTIYDMCKAVDRHMRIDELQVIEKTGGKSGDWRLDC